MSSRHQQVDEAFLREARIGLMVVSVLGAVFIYVAYGKLSGRGQPVPPDYPTQGTVAENRAEPNRPSLVQPGEYAATSVPPVLPDAASSENSKKALAGNLPSASQPPQNESALSRSAREETRVNAAELVETEYVASLDSIPVDPAKVQPGIAPPPRQSPANHSFLAANESGRQSPVVPEIKTGQSAGTFQRSDANPGGDNAFQPSGAVNEKDHDVSSPNLFENRFRSADKATGNSFGGGLRDDTLEKVAFQEPVKNARQEEEKKKKSASRIGSRNAGFEKRVADPSTRKKRDSEGSPTPAGKTNDKKQEQTGPTAKPAGATRLKEEAPRFIITKRGEGFWIVAQNEYGDGRFFDALYQFNRKNVKSFNDVPGGTQLEIPPIAELRKRWPYLCPREEITVEEGETLFEISREHLGQASRYTELLKLNYTRLPRGVDQNTPLKAGTRLELPRRR